MKTQSKTFGTVKVVMVLYDDAGATINIWLKTTAEDVESAKKLPHIYKIVDGFTLLESGNYFDQENAKNDYKHITSDRKATQYAYNLVF